MLLLRREAAVPRGSGGNEYERPYAVNTSSPALIDRVATMHGVATPRARSNSPNVTDGVTVTISKWALLPRHCFRATLIARAVLLYRAAPLAG
jgi:hypothetical protein